MSKKVTDDNNQGMLERDRWPKIGGDDKKADGISSKYYLAFKSH